MHDMQPRHMPQAFVQRSPRVFQYNVELAERFFHALAIEPDGIRAGVQESLNQLAAAYKGATGEKREWLKAMVTKQSRSEVSGVRMCAVTWACTVFEAADPFVANLCIMAASDSRPEVRCWIRYALCLAAQAGLPMHPRVCRLLTRSFNNF